MPLVVILVFLLFPGFEITRHYHSEQKFLAALVLFTGYTFLSLRQGYNFRASSTSPLPELRNLRRVTLLILVLLVGVVFYSYSQSPYQYDATLTLAAFWASILTFITVIIAINKYDTSKRETFFKILFLLVTFASLYAIAEYMGYIPPMNTNGFPAGVTGHIGHKNSFGFLVMAILPLLLHAITKKPRKVLYAQLIIVFFALLISDSRLSTVLGVLGVVVTGAVFFTKISFKTKVVLSATLLAIITIMPLLWGGAMAKRLQGLKNYTSENFRIAVYQSQWNMFKEKPLLGQGLGSFPNENISHNPEWWRKVQDHSFIPVNGHSEYLEKLSELGSVGFVLFFFFWGGALVLGYRKIRQEKDTFDFALFISMVLMFMHAGLSVAAQRGPGALMVWGVIGYFWAPVFRLQEEPRKNISRSILLGVGLVSLVVTGHFFEKLRADFHYIKSRQYISEIGTVPRLKLLEKAVQIFPYHTPARMPLFLTTVQYNSFKEAATQVDYFRKHSPRVSNSDFAAATLYAKMGQLDSAKVYARKELEYFGKMVGPTVLLIEIAHRTNDVDFLDSMQQAYPASLLWEPDSRPLIQRQKEAEQEYRSALGSLRYHFGGPFLRDAYEKKLINDASRRNEIAEKLYAILIARKQKEFGTP